MNFRTNRFQQSTGKQGASVPNNQQRGTTGQTMSQEFPSTSLLSSLSGSPLPSQELHYNNTETDQNLSGSSLSEAQQPQPQISVTETSEEGVKIKTICISICQPDCHETCIQVQLNID